MRQRVSAIAIREDKILMVKISDRGKSWWCLPGGTIEPGETPEEALIREMREELNLQVRPQRRLYEVEMPTESGIDFGISIDPPVQAPHLGVDSAVVDWTWRALDEADDSWQVVIVKQAMHK